MSGFAGVFDTEGKAVEQADVAAMLATIEHRGPDCRAMWHEGSIAIGHCGLATLDPSQLAAQPIATTDGQGILAYSGAVYNFVQLRRELEAQAAVFRSTGDAEVVLNALHLWGPEHAIPRLDGMFSFAYFDLRNRALWLARDRFGNQPLVTARVGNRLLFASEVKALLAHPQCSLQPRPERLLQWLAEPRLRSYDLLLSGLEAVEPGSWWRMDGCGQSRHVYFRRGCEPRPTQKLFGPVKPPAGAP